MSTKSTRAAKAQSSESTTTQAGEPTADAILAAVEAQRILLLNVHSTLRCLKSSAEADGSELLGALELSEMELLRISVALEGPQLRQVAAEGAQS